MPRFMQVVFEQLRHVIGCGHVSGLDCGGDFAAGRHGDARNGRKSTQRALGSWSLCAFPVPDQTDRLPLTFVDLLTCPTILLS